jgi:hypothetical protein
MDGVHVARRRKKLESRWKEHSFPRSLMVCFISLYNLELMLGLHKVSSELGLAGVVTMIFQIEGNGSFFFAV